LLGILEYIPLAITQAAAFIRRNQMSLSKYLAALKKGDENLKDFLSAELQDARRARGFPNAVFRTWMLSFNQIRDQEPHAAEILSLMALLDRREIPESLLKDPQDRDIDISTALGTLKTFALIVQEADGQTFAMHRLVQLSIHDWLGKAGKKVEYEEQAYGYWQIDFRIPSMKTPRHVSAFIPTLRQCYDISSDQNLVSKHGAIYYIWLGRMT